MCATLITLHAITASAALVAGVATLSGARRPAWFATYYGCLVAMLAFLVLAVVADWSGRSVASHLVVGPLVVLGAVMVAKADQARRRRRDAGADVIGPLGFTVVGLVDAFVVVALIGADVAGWLAAVVGVAIALGGHRIIDARRSRRSSMALRDGWHRVAIPADARATIAKGAGATVSVNLEERIDD